jgi:hypothetical protein
MCLHHQPATVPMSDPKRRVDVARIWFIASCVAAIFAYGVAVGRYQIFPFRILNYGVSSLLELRQEARVMAGVRPSWHVRTARHEGAGVTVLQQDRMAPGLTLVAGMFDGENQIRLIEPDGTPVRTWAASYSMLFPQAGHLESRRRPRTDWNVQIHGALALPDGSVVFNFDYAGTAKLDRCGNVQWTLAHPTHHSIETSEDGSYWIPGRRSVDAITGFPRSDAGYDEDLILKVSDAGEIIEEKAVADIFVANGLLHLLLLKGPGPVFRSGEVVHLNDIEELPDSIADRFAGLDAGDLMLSFRNEFLVMIVSPVDWRVKWLQTGPWVHQHDPDFQADGTITLFDNRTDDTEAGSHSGGSRILELDPASGTTRVLYGGVPDQEMHTAFLGKHQVLPNGNILITQAQGGRLLEVTGAGEIVWELVNRYDDDMVAVVTQALRYPPSYFHVANWACAQ